MQGSQNLDFARCALIYMFGTNLQDGLRKDARLLLQTVQPDTDQTLMSILRIAGSTK